jgi:hypothetical protein
MEEKKQTSESKERRKLSYEELNNACQQLFQQNQQLMRQLRENDMANMLRRLDYLFKVVENQETFTHYNGGGNFVEDCVKEIKEAMTVGGGSDTGKEG